VREFLAEQGESVRQHDRNATELAAWARCTVMAHGLDGVQPNRGEQDRGRAAREGHLSPLRGLDHDARVAVEQAELVVVGTDQQWSPEIPLPSS
jgi:hypothetical protein